MAIWHVDSYHFWYIKICKLPYIIQYSITKIAQFLYTSDGKRIRSTVQEKNRKNMEIIEFLGLQKVHTSMRLFTVWDNWPIAHLLHNPTLGLFDFSYCSRKVIE